MKWHHILVDLVYGDQEIDRRIKIMIEFINGEIIDIELVRRLESDLHVIFPKDYIEFITKNNGAYVFPNAFKLDGRVESINNFHDIKEVSKFIDERIPEKVIPIARDAGDNQICLDLRDASALSVLFWDYEDETMDDNALSFISYTFTDFLKGLFENIE